MQILNIEAMAPKPGTSEPRLGHTIYPYLLRHASVTQANQVWTMDTTYIPMAKGLVYLTAVIDVASRRVLAHNVQTVLLRGARLSMDGRGAWRDNVFVEKLWRTNTKLWCPF